MDHGISGYPEKGLENMDWLVESCISAEAQMQSFFRRAFLLIKYKGYNGKIS